MSFKDGPGSVKSLLALLQSTQDGGSPSSTAPVAGPSHHGAAPASHGSYDPNRPHQPAYSHGSSSSHPAPISSVNPTQRQLDDLLASLNNPPSSSGPSGSAFDGSRISLIQPFGPVGSRARRDAEKAKAGGGFDPNALGPAVGEGAESSWASAGPARKGKEGADRRGEKEWDEMGYTMALPVLSGLLQDEGFRKELKRMKAEQDGLERRLWAKQERLKAEHEKSLQAEKDIARITRKPVPPDRQAEWAKTLSSSLSAFYLQTVLPSLDGLSLRQTQKLQELGVPGLGGYGEERDRRVKLLMEVLQAGLEG